jgi:hypothetical protein
MTRKRTGPGENPGPFRANHTSGYANAICQIDE